ncbi:unnamed protein product [Brachionus calyciflorus]|uniref:Zinc finger CCHC domain-containing protein 7 n=1 Tax=Brachionus calyciflorus TaxID=104777 RepID=A0A813VYG3_9BILA|nr:unnamed protein product [Brachionus calyciflorus]
MNASELDDESQKNSDSDEFHTPTNLSAQNLVKFNLGPDDTCVHNETEDEQDITINEAINTNFDHRPNLINSYSNSMPQFPITHFHNPIHLANPFLHNGATNANLNAYFTLPYYPPEILMYKNNFDDKESNLETFGFFIRYTLNLSPELCKEILSNHKILHWLDRNKPDGFVYHSLPKLDESKQKMAPIRCELCKFYGHLSHNCSIKEQSFKLYNVALKSGACRCHICGQLGHPAEAGLCHYISCSFCRKFGHWNHMCPNIDKVSRTLCHKCQRYGHTTERCPDQWRQFDRISTFEQTPYKDPSETNKPVYCYQCAKPGHYGHNCPDFYRKYFIRDNHQLNPVYFFAGSSPFVRQSAELNESDKKLINNLVDRPIEDIFKTETPEQDPLEMLEKFQNKIRQEANLPPQQVSFNDFINSSTTNNIGLKKYIRRWSNWVIDFNWIYSLKFLIENLHDNKLFYMIKNYPILDNFILHWMWWSYSLNKDMEFYTKDAFRGVGSMPWLVNDDINNNNKKKKNLNKKKKKKLKKNSKKFLKKIHFTELNTEMFDSENFKCKFNRRSLSVNDFLVEKELEKFYRNDNKNVKFDEIIKLLKQNYEDMNSKNFKFSESRQKSSSIDFSELTDFKFYDSNDEENTEDLEITIVYLDKEKAKCTKVEETKEEEVNIVEKDLNSEHETSVFNKFLKSFSSGQLTNPEVSKNDDNFNKLINSLKNSNNPKDDQGLVIRVCDYSDGIPVLDSAPTVEQIETELFGSKPSSDSSDLIKFLLKIDKNPVKITNPPIFEILKNSVSPKTLTLPINIDTANQQFTSSSSSSGLSSSSISPLTFSSNPSPNSNSTNSSTAKPNIDSSFSTDLVSSSSLSLSSSSSSVSIESNGNKKIEKPKEEEEETNQIEKDVVTESTEINQNKNQKFQKSNGKVNFGTKAHYQRNQVHNHRMSASNYQNRSFQQQSKSTYNSSMKNQQYSSNFRVHQNQYQNRQFLNLKFPKSNSLPSNGKNSNPFSNNYVYPLNKPNNSTFAQTSQSSVHWQSNFILPEPNNQFNNFNRNTKLRSQYSNSSQSLRSNNNEKKDFRDHGLPLPLIQFQNVYTNSNSSSNSSTPSASFSSTASTPNNFNLVKSNSNFIQAQHFMKKSHSGSSSTQIGQSNQQRPMTMGYNNAKKNGKK